MGLYSSYRTLAEEYDPAQSTKDAWSWQLSEPNSYNAHVYVPTQNNPPHFEC